MNPRTLTITAAEWASVRDGSLWLVQEADVGQGGLLYPPVEFVEACAPCETCGDERAVFCPDCGERGPRECVGDGKPHVDCPDCRIELVGPCLLCGGSGRTLGGPLGEDVGDCRCAMTEGLIVFGHAYAFGQPLPIVGELRRVPSGPCIEVVTSLYVREWYEVQPDATHDALMHRPLYSLVHYGPPESLVGKWALQVQVLA